MRWSSRNDHAAQLFGTERVNFLCDRQRRNDAVTFAGDDLETRFHASIQQRVIKILLCSGGTNMFAPPCIDLTD